MFSIFIIIIFIRLERVMASGGKRIGSGRKEKYSKREKLIILDICKKVWKSKTKDTDHVVIQINKDTEKISFIDFDKLIINPSKKGDLKITAEVLTKFKKSLNKFNNATK